MDHQSLVYLVTHDHTKELRELLFMAHRGDTDASWQVRQILLKAVCDSPPEKLEAIASIMLDLAKTEQRARAHLEKN